jgi:hypothetical protein
MTEMRSKKKSKTGSIQGLVSGSIVQGILNGIRHCGAGHAFGAVLILTYVGIDVMAYLSLEPAREKQSRRDFIRWVENYMTLPNGESYDGADLYAARSSILHRYSAESEMTQSGDARTVLYCHGNYPPIMPHPTKPIIMLEINVLVASFKKGMKKFLHEVLADSKRKSDVERRLRKLFRYSTEQEMFRRVAGGKP